MSWSANATSVEVSAAPQKLQESLDSGFPPATRAEGVDEQFDTASDAAGDLASRLDAKVVTVHLGGHVKGDGNVNDRISVSVEKHS